MTERPPRPARFDPRATFPLVLTLAGLLALTFVRLPWLGALQDYPELRAQAPVKALLQDSLFSRTAVAVPHVFPVTWGCELCTSVGVHQAWDRLDLLLSNYGEDPPLFVRNALAVLPRARAISLATWGDPASLKIVPDPVRAVEELALDSSDPLFGVHRIPPRPVELSSWGLTFVDGLTVLLALVLFVRLRRGDAAASSAPFGASEALCVFIWAMGAAALYNMLYSLPWAEAWADWYPIPDAALAVLIAYLALRGGSWRALMRGLGFGSFETKRVLSHTVVVVGVVALFGWVIKFPLNALGHNPPWAQISGDLLRYGSTYDKWVRGFSLVVTTPLHEEAMFTGLLFGGLATRLSFRSSALITGALFAAEHSLDLLGTVDFMVGSVASCWAFWRTGSLWPSVLAHALLNASYASLALY